MVKILIASFKHIFGKDNYDIVKIIYLYRYLSWFITSIFYIISGPHAPIIYKIGVSLSLLVAARLTTNLYIKNKENTKTLKYYIFVETLGITVLLLPTGGISSPFIWYALNPVLVAASFLPFIFSWINLFFYIETALIISYLFFNNEEITLFQMVNNNSNSVLVLLLITLMVGMLSALTRQLNKKTVELQCKGAELEKINKMLEDNLENIMSLYQVVEAFYNQDSLENFLNAFTEYTIKLTKAKSAFFWMTPYKEMSSTLAIKNIKASYNKLYNEIEELWSNSSDSIIFAESRLVESDFLIVSVKSQARHFGLIGIGIDNSCYPDNKENYIQKLNFLAELSAVIFERFHFEEVANNLLIVEEQNRIANEIHDSVSQRIFSLTCALHSLKSRWSSMTDEQIAVEVGVINDTAKNAMKELRFAIYGLSYKKRGERIFEENIKNYINEISSLNNITVGLDIKGDADGISNELKKVLHRIIHEASGNAIRHGKCKNLNISLLIDNDNVKLSIIDNGTGFKADTASNGYELGIYNMKKMVQAFNGKLDLISSIGEGTKLYISIPINTVIKREEGAVFENCNCG